MPIECQQGVKCYSKDFRAPIYWYIWVLSMDIVRAALTFLVQSVSSIAEDFFSRSNLLYEGSSSGDGIEREFLSVPVKWIIQSSAYDKIA